MGASQRCQEFLRFVVEQSLAGHADSLKERTIGVEAFGRAADYETNLDGVVRIKASEVRKRLSLYYAGSGKAAKVVIEYLWAAMSRTSRRVILRPHPTAARTQAQKALPQTPGVKSRTTAPPYDLAEDHRSESF